MLRLLRVQEFALVGEAEVAFGAGLNLLTGETGSGKSLLVDALQIALGARASQDQVRAGAETALVEAQFDIAELPQVQARMAELGYQPDELLTLTREFGRRSGARINGRPASPGQLRELGRLLLSIHGQHEQQELLDPDRQTDLLDSFAETSGLRDEVLQAHTDWRQAVTAREELERLQARGQREEEYLRWQLKELQEAELQEGEDEHLRSERERVRHSVRLGELADSVLAGLGSDDGLGRAARAASEAKQLDSGVLELAARLEQLEIEADDLRREWRRYGERLEFDPERLAEIEDRLALLETLKRKYGGSLAAAIEERERIAAQVGQMEDMEGAIAEAQAKVAAARAVLEEGAGRLRAARERAARSLSEAMEAELQGLRLEGARFVIQLQPLPDITARGGEAAEFCFSANPKEPLGLLAKVASGGELSRVMLALKSIGSESMPTLIFDEVDTGIGGETALQLGIRLARLAQGRQILVVTHLPQVAAFADCHLVVEKRPSQSGRMMVAVAELKERQERTRELARLMAGSVTEKGVARAEELLEEAQRLRAVAPVQLRAV